MIRANQIGTQYPAIIELPNGTQRRIQLPNKAAYDSVSENSVQSHIKANERRAKLIGATEEPLLDTPSGSLENGYYLVVSADNVIIKQNDRYGYTVESNTVNDEIVDNEQVLWL